MRAALLGANARWLALPRRERALLAGAAVVCILGAGDVFLLEPALKERARLLHQIDDQNTARTALEAAAGAATHDPDASAKQQLAALGTQLRATERDFQTMQNGLVQPQQMGALLQSLLAEQQGLRLLGLRSLPVTALSEAMTASRKASGDKVASLDKTPASGTPPRDEAWLYRHAVEVRVQGSYADMLAYLRAIEGLPRRVRWGDVEIDARTYPASTMTITLYTVSLEKSWWVL